MSQNTLKGRRYSDLALSSILSHPSAFLPLPLVATELLAIEPPQLAHDYVLLLLDELFHPQAHRRLVVDGGLAFGLGISFC